ncbi:MAG: ABC transporter permease [Desulfovibrio sp.]|jgi:putative ABC transport system permease protein|nr:ABC transporter permease [Desulfovibrio sp.]
MRLGHLLKLAARSAWNRRGTLCLIVLSVALSTMLLLGIERIRGQARESFAQSISGTDLIVGARGSGTQLMLYAIFHLGGATNNMGWKSAERLARHADVAWAVPLSLGDSHKGHPVIATTEDYFTRYAYRRGQHLRFAQGRAFAEIFDVVLGSETAKSLNYALGVRITLSHGASGTGLTEHADKPFTVVGILSPTGTPIDRSLYISLPAMEAIHLDWEGGAPIPGFRVTPEQVRKFNLEPKSVTALLLGLKSRGRVFALQRIIAADREEALMAVLPGVALDELWRMVNMGEQALLLISLLVMATGLAGLASAILAGLGERRRELAILRSVGACPEDILLLLSFEGLLVMLSGVVLGMLVLAALMSAVAPAIADACGILLYVSLPDSKEWLLVAGIMAAGFCASLLPALRAYRMSLSDGLTLNT